MSTHNPSSKKPAWGHVSRHCVYCGKVGPRSIVAGGWAHKRCIPFVGKRRGPR
jgi:hypothetical protein